MLKIITQIKMMVARRNWILRCSILINIAVLMYLCSHVMIGSSNMTIGPSYLIQEDNNNNNNNNNNILNSNNNNNNNNNKNHNIKSQQPILTQESTGVHFSERRVQNAEMPEKITQLQTQSQHNNNNLQQQQQQQQQQQSSSSQLQQLDQIKEIENQNQNIDDSRFEVPTEQNYVPIKNEPVYQDVNLINQTYGDNLPTDGGLDLEARLKILIKCHDVDFEPTIGQRGDFWVLRNYIRAEHGELRCLETLTYTTHSDYTFLDNLIPLLERWNAPVSVAMHAPGTDFTPTINSIKYLRDCIPESHLVRQFATFHIYFSSKHIPKNVPKYNKVLETPYNCTIPPPFSNITSATQLYKTQKKLLYPVNVGRNVARDAAMTHFILASDIELYPNPGLTRKFLEMIARNDVPFQRTKPRVYPLSIFEVDTSSNVPRDKTELQELLRTGKAIPFHKRVCSSCHGVPKSKEWMAANETDELGIFHIGKRVGYYVHWEPIYIGTHADPHYDERLSWEGKSDKMTQGYALCVLDYEFHILDNGFLVHKPGIKILKKDPKRAMLAAKTNQLIKKIIYPELQVIYGVRKGCAV